MNTSVYLTVKEIDFYKKCAEEYNIKEFSVYSRFDPKGQKLSNKPEGQKTIKNKNTR